MSIQETNLKAIADAIRAKTGLTGTIKASEFASKIAAIEGGSKMKVSMPPVIYNSSEWKSIACNGYRLISITNGKESGITWSDIYNWSSEELPISESLNAVIWGKDKFVAIGNSDIIYSATGSSWTKGTRPPLAYIASASLIYADGKFMVLDSGGTGAYSTDGVAWTTFSLPSINMTNGGWATLAYGNNKFVATTYSSANADAAYSTDGITWTKTTLPTNTVGGYTEYGNGRFLTIPANISKDAAYSIDGITWTKTVMPVEAIWYTLAFGNGKFVAAAGNSPNKIYYTSDGITWNVYKTPLDSDVNNGSIRKLIYWEEKSMFVGIGYRGQVIYIEGL